MSAMIKKGFVLCCLAFVFGLGAEEAQKTAEAKTPEMKIAVLDFTCIDLVGQKLRLMKDKPLLGVGLNNWGIKINPPYPYCEYRYGNKRIAPDFKEGIVESSYLLVGAECGLPALAAFFVWLG